MDAKGGMGNQLQAMAGALVAAACTGRRVSVAMHTEGSVANWLWHPTRGFFKEPFEHFQATRRVRRGVRRRRLLAAGEASWDDSGGDEEDGDEAAGAGAAGFADGRWQGRAGRGNSSGNYDHINADNGGAFGGDDGSGEDDSINFGGASQHALQQQRGLRGRSTPKGMTMEQFLGHASRTFAAARSQRGSGGDGATAIATAAGSSSSYSFAGDGLGQTVLVMGHHTEVSNALRVDKGAYDFLLRCLGGAGVLRGSGDGGGDGGGGGGGGESTRAVYGDVVACDESVAVRTIPMQLYIRSEA